MNRLLFILFLFGASSSFSQTLNVPPRSGGALTGSQVVSAITNLSLHDREVYILNEVLNGNIPDFQRNMILIEDSAFISGAYVHIEYYVIPDYIALGSDADYYLCPMTPILAQRLADSLNCILPTRKMVDNIWSHATVKMNPESIAPSAQMTTVPVMNDHNDMVWTQRQSFLPGNPLGELVAGDKKDVVLSNLIYTNAPPARVVIYGWHYTNGTNIQPLYAGHIDTYADYSHGIRFIQMEVYVDGTPMDAETVLSSSTLNPLLSDEGVLSQPYYPDTATGTTPTIQTPEAPKSFCVMHNSATSIDINIAIDNNVDAYEVYLSNDGTNFNFHQQYASNAITLNGLQSDQIYFVKLLAENSAGVSGFSEVLGTVTTDSIPKYLIVNGFDRGSAGNTYNFIRQHGIAIWNDTIAFSSATNDAVIDGLVTLANYPALDYILGEESTVDETFDSNEQALIQSYLNAGGYLFVSGAEIAWDLHQQGSTQDKSFCENYLKSFYYDDAPNGTSGTYYEFHGSGNGLFDTLSTTTFDDGSNGTYDVNYPDVLLGIAGGVEVLEYSGVTNQSAAIKFEGPFPGASIQDTGKLVLFGFPFETVYPEGKRFTIMQEINDFFFPPMSTPTNPGVSIIEVNKQQPLFYPNPSSEIITIDNAASITIYDMMGRMVLNKENLNENEIIDISSLSEGVYNIILDGKSDKLIIQK